MKTLHIVAYLLLWIGGLNLGLSALGFDVVSLVLGSVGGVTQIFNILVGASTVYIIATHKNDCKVCGSK